MKITRYQLVVCILAATFVLGMGTWVNASPELSIDSYNLVSTQRISRTVFEFTYTATVVNNGTSEADMVSGLFTIDSPHTEVIDGKVEFGIVGAGGTITSKDTYTIRQDRRYPFDSQAVVWQFSFLPPDPGEAGKQTLLGIDSDNDGVRDDIQRYIYFTYPDEKNVRSALLQIAKNYQELLPNASDPENSYKNVIRLNRSRACLYYIKGGVRNSMNIQDALFAEIHNTDERSFAYLKFSNSLAGKTATLPSMSERKDCCLFDIDAGEIKND